MQVLADVETALTKTYGFKIIEPSLQKNFSNLLDREGVTAVQALIASNFLLLYAYIKDVKPGKEISVSLHDSI